MIFIKYLCWILHIYHIFSGKLLLSKRLTNTRCNTAAILKIFFSKRWKSRLQLKNIIRKLSSDQFACTLIDAYRKTFNFSEKNIDRMRFDLRKYFFIFSDFFYQRISWNMRIRLYQIEKTLTEAQMFFFKLFLFVKITSKLAYFSLIMLY